MKVIQGGAAHLPKIVIREFSPQLLSLAHEWWKKQGWPLLPLDALSKSGLVIYSGEDPVCMGWLYKTDSSFGILEWIVANPEIRGERRRQALDVLIQTFLSIAKIQGMKLIFTSLRNESLKSKLVQAGFQVSDENMINLIWRA